MAVVNQYKFVGTDNDTTNGELNPFDDMQNHNPKGAGQFGSINKPNNPPPTSNKERLPDDTKLEL